MMKYDRKYISDEAVEKYDDARFALLMEGYSARLGEEYAEENRQLQEDDSFEFPAELDAKCMKAIDGAIARKQRRENIEKAKKIAKRVTVMAASFLIVIAISSVVLYNTVEAFRVVVSDYAIELFDVGEGSLVSVESNEDKDDIEVVPTWLPEGYALEYNVRRVGGRMMKYSDGQNTITFTTHSDVSAGGAVIDTENAVETYDIKILEYDGVAVKRAHDFSLYWFEDNTSYYIWTDTIEPDIIIRMAESCYE